MIVNTITNCYAAIDIGASSGRIVIGEVLENDAAKLSEAGASETEALKARANTTQAEATTTDAAATEAPTLETEASQKTIKLTEVHRFDNIQLREDGHDCWNIKMLFEEVVKGLAKCKECGFEPKSIGIDTWGVDFVLLDKHDKLLGSAVAYRDARTAGMYKKADELIAPEEVYRKTGIQRQPFNTIYQLLALQGEHPDQLENAHSFLMIPDYLNFLLTGIKVNEYTNATTTSLLNARTQKWDKDILDALNLPKDMFCDIVMPGTMLGKVQSHIEEQIGYSTCVIAPATHDTGSAYLAIPARDKDAVFLSSGTWSLLGVEHEGPITSDASRFQNFTNEGGYELRFRFLKNIMGLWMIQSVRRELNGVSYVEDGSEDSSADGAAENSADGAAEGGSAEGAAKGAKDASSESFATQESQETAATTPQEKLAPFENENKDKKWGFEDLIAAAKAADGFQAQVNVNDDRFLSPASMIEEIRLACLETGQPVPKNVGELLRCIYISLSKCYAESIAEMAALTGRNYTSINIVGGGCQDEYLNTLTAKACNLPVFAGPVEGTSLGNLAVQMLESKDFNSLESVRRCIETSFDVVCFK